MKMKYVLGLFLLCGCYPAHLQEINNKVNKVLYVKDVGNDWKTPERFFKEGGDCEDYVLAKKYLLEQKGVDSKILIVYDKVIREYHAVLLVDTWVLDNTTNKIKTLKEFMKFKRHVGVLESKP